MKYTAAALALALAPMALAKAVHNVYPLPIALRAEGGNQADSKKETANKGSKANENNNNNKDNNNNNNNGATTTEVIIIWVNNGGGAATTTVNQAVTVTETVTAGATQAVTTTAAAGALTTHTVIVGGAAGLAFSPAEIKAAKGDMVVFQFESNNHTATQSAFATPCDPLAGGMDSNFQPNVNNTVVPPPQVAMQVMVDTPLWFYCRQKGHCGKGMTFSINPTADKTQAMFQAMAIAQKGTGTGSAITGNATSSAGTGTATETATATEAATTTAAEAGSTTVAGITTGTGAVDNTGACVCAVSCAAGSFPAIQVQGVGAFGGLGGALPASMAEK